MTQSEKARRFAALHMPGDPVVLYNIWDAGGAKAVADAGAKAVATASWSVAAAHGFADGQAIPLDLLLAIVARVVVAIDLPVTVDFEGGFADAPADVAANVVRVLDTGAVGINFEDQVVGGAGLHAVADQQARIAAIRAMADARNVPLFINARTDVFLQEPQRDLHRSLLPQAIARGLAYKTAGAAGFFVPGLMDADLLAQVCAAVGLPVNAMMLPGAPAKDVMAVSGIARISHGPGPYRAMIAAFGEAARGALS